MSERPLVFGLGLPRTGTSSLRAAMAELGWRVQTDPFEDERLKLLFAGRVREAVERDLARGFTYLSEPYFAWADQVREAYPSAPVIYTVRDYVGWRASLKAFLAGRPRRSRPHWATPSSSSEVRILSSLIWGVWLPWFTPVAAWTRSLAHAPKEAALRGGLGRARRRPVCAMVQALQRRSLRGVAHATAAGAASVPSPQRDAYTARPGGLNDGHRQPRRRSARHHHPRRRRPRPTHSCLEAVEVRGEQPPASAPKRILGPSQVCEFVGTNARKGPSNSAHLRRNIRGKRDSDGAPKGGISVGYKRPQNPRKA